MLNLHIYTCLVVYRHTSSSCLLDYCSSHCEAPRWLRAKISISNQTVTQNTNFLAVGDRKKKADLTWVWFGEGVPVQQVSVETQGGWKQLETQLPWWERKTFVFRMLPEMHFNTKTIYVACWLWVSTLPSRFAYSIPVVWKYKIKKIKKQPLKYWIEHRISHEIDI